MKIYFYQVDNFAFSPKIYNIEAEASDPRVLHISRLGLQKHNVIIIIIVAVVAIML